MKLDFAIEEYLRQLRADGRSVHTQKQAARHLKLLGRTFREHELGEIGHQEIARLFTSPAALCKHDGGIKRATSLNAMRSSVRTFFAFVHGAGYVSSNPAR